MKKLIPVISLIFLLALVTAQPQPNPPQQFYGNVFVNSNVAPDGMGIEARIDNETFSSITANGRYGIIPNTMKIPFEIGREGKLIEFFIVGVSCTEKASENATFESGAITKLNLNFNVPEVCLPKPPVQESNSGNSGGSGGGGSDGGGGSIITRNKQINTTNSTSIGIQESLSEDNSEDEIQNEGNRNEEIKNNNKFSPARILGAVIGPGGAVQPLGAIIFAIIIVALALIVVFIRKRARKNQ